jgi:hypothetical protein
VASGYYKTSNHNPLYNRTPLTPTINPVTEYSIYIENHRHSTTPPPPVLEYIIQLQVGTTEKIVRSKYIFMESASIIASFVSPSEFIEPVFSFFTQFIIIIIPILNSFPHTFDLDWLLILGCTFFIPFLSFMVTTSSNYIDLIFTKKKKNGPMLFSIYLASLVTFSSGMELSRRLVDPKFGTAVVDQPLPPQKKCKLYVTVGAVAKGWIRMEADNTLTAMGTDGPDTQTAFPDAQEFQWGLPVQNGAFPTVYTIHMSPSLRLLLSGMYADGLH